MESIPSEILTIILANITDGQLVTALRVCARWRLIASNILHKRITDPQISHPLFEIYLQKISMSAYADDWQNRIKHNAILTEIYTVGKYKIEREKDLALEEFRQVLNDTDDEQHELWFDDII